MGECATNLNLIRECQLAVCVGVCYSHNLNYSTFPAS